ncbi:hypothetical protein A5893_13780 [Pedobacter psychrophilus]|uniref:Uncharacterized protein n=1 Tax=Pedobacter psychrophilus TaxID=1826909 RepID=A0A179DCR1_9SPHI|nr:hypothetical protein [Pedobacter psychrophilus]OAQ38490.1 hypothetical protein A5893_13780 [Pedobacter psychrophilus]
MIKKFKLIEGIFSASDAKEILLNLIEEKIKFHELRSFSDEVKQGKKNDESLLKVAELNDTKSKIKALLEKVENGKNLKINSFIEIEN